MLLVLPPEGTLSRRKCTDSSNTVIMIQCIFV